MAASADTALQVNYKLPDGTLVNVYAKDALHLESLLVSIKDDLAALIMNTASDLGVSATPATNQAYLKAALGAEEISADKQCKHGAMTLKTGTSAKGPWKGWMCNAPKGAPDKCDVIWVRN